MADNCTSEERNGVLLDWHEGSAHEAVCWRLIKTSLLERCIRQTKTRSTEAH